MTNEISTEEQQQQQQVHQPTPPKGLVKNRRAIFEQAQQQQQQQVHQPSPPKGLVKNKRAIFEQAQQQQQQAHQPTLARRSSGAIITKRVDTFKSLDFGTSAVSSSVIDSTTNNSAVKKLANSFADQVSIGTGGNQVTRSPAPIVIRKEVEQVTLTREEDIFSSAKETAAPSAEEDVTTTSDHHVSSIDAPASPSQSPRPQLQQNGGNKEADVSQDENGNSENSFSEKSPEKTADNNTTSEVITNEELIMNGQNSNIKAIALFDYQAADNTEISFDPDDKIGQIQKVDPGWWHGQVISGRFKGQIGLFPSNYVQEL